MFGWGRFGSCPALTPVSELLSKRRAEFCNWVGVAAGCGQGSVFRYNLHVQVLGKKTTVLSPGVPGLPVSLSWSGRGG